MPNHVTNVIVLQGDRIEINNVLEKIKNDEYGIGTIDFEKIVPMPNHIYRGNLGAKEQNLYGKNNWYDWSLANWGTKWNAYGYHESEDYSQKEKLTFLTAWAAPHPIMEKLAEMFPEIDMVHQWADEDIGMNCGRYTYSKGERMEEYFPETQKDCIEFAASVMDVDPESYGLYLNASENRYINLDDNEYEVIEMAGEMALFTNERMTDDDIPKGLHCYHLRHSDDGDGFASIEKIVTVNHGGSVITSEPIDLGEKGFITLNDDTEPNFIGETSTLTAFLNNGNRLSMEETEDMEMQMY